MKILVISSHGIGAWLIKLFTFSKWNHTAVLFDDSNDIDNCSVVDVTASSGVRVMSFYRFKKIYKNIEILDTYVPDENAGKSFALSQIGKKYDWGAIFGIIFQNRNWESRNRWFCAELSETIRVESGRRVFRSDISGILPRELYAVI